MKEQILAALFFVMITLGTFFVSNSLPFHNGNNMPRYRPTSMTNFTERVPSKNATRSNPFGLKATIQRPSYRSSGREVTSGDLSFEEVEIDINSFLGPEISWRIENKFFRGHLCILIQDHPRCNYDFDNQTDVYFEIQVQGQFKRKPKGPIYLGVEIPKKKKLNISWSLRVFINAAVAFMKKWGYKWIHLSLGEDNVHVPLISSPAFQAFDRLVITPMTHTKEDVKLPPLGYTIPDNKNSKKMKAFKFDHKICTENIYTMSFNHSYFDIVRWRMTDIPMVKTFSLNFTRSLRLTMYEIDDGANLDTDGHVEAIATSKHHVKRNVMFWIKFEKVRVQV